MHKKGGDFSREVLKFVKKGSGFSWEVMNIIKKGSDFSKEVLKCTKKVIERLGVLTMVVETCSFYDVFLKVAFKQHVTCNETLTFRNIRKKNELIASELYSLESSYENIYNIFFLI